MNRIREKKERIPYNRFISDITGGRVGPKVQWLLWKAGGGEEKARELQFNFNGGRERSSNHPSPNTENKKGGRGGTMNSPFPTGSGEKEGKKDMKLYSA